MDTLVLLGAGASHGSFLRTSEAPPLGNGVDGLFARLVSRSQEAASLSSQLKQIFARNFEEGMSEYFRAQQGNVARLQLDIGAYLASFRPTPGNAHFDLLEATDPSRTIYASLNYDTLLEEAALLSGWNIAYSSVAPGPAVRVIKPHGSSNFWPNIAPGTIRGCTFVNCGTDVEAPVICLHPEASRARYPQEDSFSPCMSLYAPDKPVRTSPGFVKEQQQLFAESVSRVSRLILAGVRVYPSDRHIWAPLFDSTAELHYFGLDWDREQFDQWAGGRSAPAHFHEHGFREAVDTIPSLQT